MTPIIHIDGEPLIAVLNERGWVQGQWETTDGRVCAHQAIRLCSPQLGDSFIVEQVAERQGWGTIWNDKHHTTEADVRARLGAGIDVTDADLADTFGPQWRAVVSLVRRAATLTADEMAVFAVDFDVVVALSDIAHRAAYNANLGAAFRATRSAAHDAVYYAAAHDDAHDDAYNAVRTAAYAARAVATWHLTTGLYTVAHRDLLIYPWKQVCGLPEGLLDTVQEGW